MREILFRGKTPDGRWVEGFYGKTTVIGKDTYIAEVIYSDETTLFSGEWDEIIPETVGQYTGLRDCKRTKEYPEGQKIFEGDIVATKYKLGRGGYYVFEVYYNENLCQFALTINSGSYTKNKQYDWLQLTELKANKIEVIGNIHDNPELLKGDKSDA